MLLYIGAICIERTSRIVCDAANKDRQIGAHSREKNWHVQPMQMSGKGIAVAANKESHKRVVRRFACVSFPKEILFCFLSARIRASLSSECWKLPYLDHSLRWISIQFAHIFAINIFGCAEGYDVALINIPHRRGEKTMNKIERYKFLPSLQQK